MPVAVITGGASGFGRALGEECVRRGFSVALLDRDGARAAEAAAALDGPGASVTSLAVDVAEATSVEAAADDVAGRFGAVDLVVSNVGVQRFGGVDRLTDDEWRWVLDVNVIGAARVTRAFVPLLARSARGRLAFTASASVLDPASRLAAYQASKFAVWGLAETLRLELADRGIGVTVVFPYGMATRHLESSEAAQPATVTRPALDEEDLLAMAASNPAMVESVVEPELVVAGVLDGILAGEPYVLTHGDLTGPVDARGAALRAAAETARDA